MKLQSILLLVVSSSAIVIREEPRDLPRCSTDPTVDDGHFRQDGLKVHPNYKDLKIHQDYANLAAEQYSLLTSENACKMTMIAKSFTENDFTGCEYIRDYA